MGAPDKWDSTSILLPHFDAIDMKFASQIIDMFFDACRRPTPVTELLPSNETKQVIAAGPSKSSSQGSISLGKISSSLECWFKHRPYLQVSLSLSLSMHEILPCGSLILNLVFFFVNLFSFSSFYCYPKVHVNVFLPLFH